MARSTRLFVLLPTLPFLFLGLAHHALPASAAPTAQSAQHASAVPAAAAASDDAAGSFSVSDTKVHVYDLAGHVELVAGTGPAVKIDATFGGHDGSRLGVANVARDGTAFVVKFPGDHIRWSADRWRGHTTIQVNDDGTFDDRGGIHMSGRRVRIDDQDGGLDAWADLRIFVPRGQQVVVHVGVGRITATNVDGDVQLDGASADVSVNGGAGRLKVATGSGDITASGVTGEQSFDTGSGSVHARDLSGDDVRFGTGSGDVTATAIRTPNLKARTGSGQIEIENARAQAVVLATGSGDVSIHLLSGLDRLKIDTGSGSVHIMAPTTLGASVRVGTGSGGIDSNFALKEMRRGDGSLSGVIGDGHGEIFVSTGSGSVRIEHG